MASIKCEYCGHYMDDTKEIWNDVRKLIKEMK